MSKENTAITNGNVRNRNDIHSSTQTNGELTLNFGVLMPLMATQLDSIGSIVDWKNVQESFVY